MKARPIDQLVFEYMFPKPKSTDPQNFHAFLQRNLVTEVRQETACFYGSLDSREAQYPGLDYSHAPHRARLSRFTWHRRLFRAFDVLNLTKSEIAGLTKWEGTRWAKERFEREQGIKIRDTTGDGIQDWVDPKLRRPVRNLRQAQEAELVEMEDVQEGEEDTDGMDEDEDEDESEFETESVGVELNERLRAAAALRESGNATNTVMDEEWENWLKEAAEAGGIPFLTAHAPSTSNNVTSGQSTTVTALPPRLLNAARLGQWHQIPDFLHNMLRRNIETNNLRANESSTPSAQEWNTGENSGARVVSTTPAINTQQRQPITPIPSLRRISLTRSHQAATTGGMTLQSSPLARSAQSPRS